MYDGGEINSGTRRLEGLNVLLETYIIGRGGQTRKEGMALGRFDLRTVQSLFLAPAAIAVNLTLCI
jgi:hypothetical protein